MDKINHKKASWLGHASFKELKSLTSPSTTPMESTMANSWFPDVPSVHDSAQSDSMLLARDFHVWCLAKYLETWHHMGLYWQREWLSHIEVLGCIPAADGPTDAWSRKDRRLLPEWRYTSIYDKLCFLTSGGFCEWGNVWLVLPAVVWIVLSMFICLEGRAEIFWISFKKEYFVVHMTKDWLANSSDKLQLFVATD